MQLIPVMIYINLRTFGIIRKYVTLIERWSNGQGSCLRLRVFRPQVASSLAVKVNPATVLGSSLLAVGARLEACGDRSSRWTRVHPFVSGRHTPYSHFWVLHKNLPFHQRIALTYLMDNPLEEISGSDCYLLL